MFGPKTLIDQAKDRKNKRSTHEGVWSEIAELMRPERHDMARRPPGGKVSRRIFASSPIQSGKNFAAGLFSAATNPATEWFRVGSADRGLIKFSGVREWEDFVTKVHTRSFAPTNTSFYSNVPETFLDLGHFGTAVFYSEYIPSQNRIYDAALSLAQCVPDFDGRGELVGMDRFFPVQAGKLQQFFPDIELPDKIKRKAKKQPLEKIEILHSVYLNENIRQGALGPDGKQFLSQFIIVDGHHSLGTGGFFEMPYFVPRWSSPDELGYSVGPGHIALPDVKGLNVMKKAHLKNIERIADPPLLAPNERAISVIRNVPGKVSYGAVTRTGQALVRPMEINGNVFATDQEMEQTRESIKDIFFFSLMQLVQRTGMTATEILAREEEKLRLMGPHLGRLQAEFLSPLIKRRFEILVRAGKIPPAPPELEDQELEIEYISPMAKAQKQAEAAGVLRTWEFAQGVSAIAPEALDNLNADRSVRLVSEAFGAPSMILNDEKKVKKTREERLAAENAARALQVTSEGAGAVKDLAEAGANLEL